MKYENVVEGIFLSRPNRFVAEVDIEGKVHTVHVKNTGRCKELLIKGRKCYLSKSNNPNRKTHYDLISVVKKDALKNRKTELLVNLDSQGPNQVFYDYAKEGYFLKDIIEIKREFTYENSRFDCYIKTKDKEHLIEIKGVTLEEDGIAKFPDAPTERGVKHINELIKANALGYESHIVFIIQMKGTYGFMPNEKTHPEFKKVLEEGRSKGVKIHCLEADITPDTMKLNKNSKSIPLMF